MVVTLSNIEGLRISGKTGKIAMLNFDGKKGVTVQDVMDALYDVGKEFNNVARSREILVDFAAKGKDSKSLVSSEELVSIFEKNPKSLAGLKILDGSKVFLVSVGADGKGKIEEEKTIVAPKKEAELKRPETSQKPSLTVPSQLSTTKIAVPLNSNEALVEKHLERFMKLFNLNSGDAAETQKARTCLREILQHNNASKETINNVMRDHLGIKWGFNDNSFSAFGIDSESGVILTPDEFLTNVETTIIDFNKGGKSSLEEYAKHSNFYIIGINSNFGKSNVSVFRQNALKVLKDKKAGISDDADLAEIVKNLLDDKILASNDVNPQVSFLRRLADQIKGNLDKGIDLNSLPDKKDAIKRAEINKNIERRIHVELIKELSNKLPDTISGLDSLLGMSPEMMFRGIYRHAKDNPQVYENGLNRFIEDGGFLLGTKGLGGSLFDKISNFIGTIFNGNKTDNPPMQIIT